MKSLTILLLAVLPQILNAQDTQPNSAVFFGFNNTDSGRSISASYMKEKEKFDWGIGLGMNIRRIAQPDNFNHTYRKRLYPYEPIHFIAYNAFYHKKIFRHLQSIQPFLFYDLQVRYSPTRTETISEAGILDSVEQTYFYVKDVYKFGPYYWAENTFGIGFKFELTERLLFQQKVGMGINLIMGRDKYGFINHKPYLTWEAAHLFQFGLVYRFI